nr:nucleotide-binding alpha-beta plait domain-containing protein [Tanacetum cinerariifolium]
MVMSGSQRSKEDDVQKISTSVFVTNFPDGYGKRFGFVRFIKVLDKDRLINNLCTVWVGRNKIHANVARFQREPLHKESNMVNNKGTNNVNHGAKGMENSYAHVVKGNQVQNVGMKECPNMVLDETCLNHEDFSLCLLGKVKEFASLTNLNVVLDEWLYGWRLRAFHVSGGLEIHLAVSHVDGVRAIEVPGWVPDFEEDGEEGYDVNDGSHEDDMYGGVSKNLKDVECESDREEVIETNFEEVLNKKRDGKNINDKHEDSLKYPPGFTPSEDGDVPVEKVDNWSDENRVNDGQEDEVCVGQHVHERVEVLNDTHESTCYGHFKKSEVPRKDGSILE